MLLRATRTCRASPDTQRRSPLSECRLLLRCPMRHFYLDNGKIVSELNWPFAASQQVRKLSGRGADEDFEANSAGLRSAHHCGSGMDCLSSADELGSGSLSFPGLADTSTQAGFAGRDISRWVQPPYEKKRDLHYNGWSFNV